MAYIPPILSSEYNLVKNENCRIEMALCLYDESVVSKIFICETVEQKFQEVEESLSENGLSINYCSTFVINIEFSESNF